MSEQSQTLYRKWRSQTFSELVGQEAVTRTLRQAVANGRLSHAYLFCGPRGTGKTSTARLLAKMINCAHPLDGEPDNACDSCREITEGRSTDVIEIDAASNRGIDDIRNLRDRVRVSSALGNTRIFVVDECHMLTVEAFNALLKTLEEPPPKVIFVLATTDPQKIPETVVSRCQRFDFRRITLRDLIGHLAYVAQQEAMTIEPGALELVARAARGGMRDALSLLDQLRAFGGDTLTTEVARQMLGLADPAQIRDLIGFVAAADTAAGLHRIHDLAQSGVDLRQLGSQIGELWRHVMLARAGADIMTILDLAPEDAADLKRLAGRFELTALTTCARIFARTDVGPQTQIVPQLALELAFLECVAALQLPAAVGAPPAPAVTPARTSPPIPTLGVPQSTGATLARLAESPAPPLAKPEPSPSSPPLTYTSAPEDRPQTFQVAPTSQAAAPGNVVSPLLQGQEQRVGDSDSALTLQLRQQWDTFRKIAKQRSNKVFGVLGNTHCSRIEAGSPIHVVLGTQYDFHFKELTSAEHRVIIDWALQQTLDRPCRYSVILEPEAPPITPGTPIPSARSQTPNELDHAAPDTILPGPSDEFPWDEPPTRVQEPATPPSEPSRMHEGTPTGLSGALPSMVAAANAPPMFSDGASDPRQRAEHDPVVQALIQAFGGTVSGVVPFTPPNRQD